MFSCFRLCNSWVLWLLVSLAAIPGYVAGQSQDSDRVLSDIKSSLLEYALDNKAFVSATSWISGSGSLEEELLVYNRLRLEELRFQTFDYGKGDSGARLYKFGTLNKVRRFGSRLRSSDENIVCDLPVPRKQRLLLEIQKSVSTDAISLNLSSHANKVISEAIKSKTAQSFYDQSMVIYEPRMEKSGYQSYFTGVYSGPSDLKLVIESYAVRAEVKRALKNALNPWKTAPRSYHLAISVSIRSLDGVVLWSKGLDANVSSQDSQVLLTHLSESAISQIRNWSEGLLPLISKQARCNGKITLGLANGSSGSGSIIGGKDVGIFKGQRFILAPKDEQLRLAGLEKGLSMVSLAEVVSVYEHSALFDVYAGMAELDYDNMLAIPLSHAGVFEG